MSNTEKIKPREYVSPIPIAPGETLKEIINELNMSQKEVAERLGVTQKHLSFIITGKSEISRDFAEKLEYVLGTDSLFWLELENEYRDALKKINPIQADEKNSEFKDYKTKRALKVQKRREGLKTWLKKIRN